MTKKTISSDKLPAPVGPFSSAVSSQGFVFLSGQVGQDPVTKKVVDGGVEAQTAQIFSNLAAVLEAAGKTLSDVVRVGVYLTDMNDFAAMNTVYAEHLREPYPARTTIAVLALPFGAAVEIDMVAE